MGDGPIDAWGTVTDSSMGFGASAPAADDAPDPTDLLTTFPADSWLAFAAVRRRRPDRELDRAVQGGLRGRLRGRGPEPRRRRSTRSQMFQDATGLNLEQDLAWIGDVGGFVEGTSIFGLGGGLVITTDDQGAAEDAVGEAPAGDRQVARSQGDAVAERLRHPGAGRADRCRRWRSRTTRSSSPPAPTPSTTCSRRRRRSATRTRSRRRRTISATT